LNSNLGLLLVSVCCHTGKALLRRLVAETLYSVISRFHVFDVGLAVDVPGVCSAMIDLSKIMTRVLRSIGENQVTIHIGE